mgnify:CR=1 FL=1
MRREGGRAYRDDEGEAVFLHQIDGIHRLGVDAVEREEGGIGGAHLHRDHHFIDRRCPEDDVFLDSIADTMFFEEYIAGFADRGRFHATESKFQPRPGEIIDRSDILRVPLLEGDDRDVVGDVPGLSDQPLIPGDTVVGCPAGDEDVALPGELHLADECPRTGEVIFDVDAGLLGERLADLVHRFLETRA